MNYRIIIYFSILNLTLFSCGKKDEKEKIKPEKVKKIVQVLKNNEIEYNTVFIKKLSIDFNDQNKHLKAKGYIKSIKDSMITISIVPFLGIEMARIYLRKDSIFVLNRLEKTTYVNSYKYFNDIYKMNISLNDIQKLILNSFKLFDELYNSKYTGKTSINNGNHVIEINDVFNYKLIISGETNKLKSTSIIDEKNNVQFIINYLGYKPIRLKEVPTKIEAFLNNDGHKYLLKLNYSNIEIDNKVIDNFNLNQQYKRVLLK